MTNEQRPNHDQPLSQLQDESLPQTDPNYSESTHIPEISPSHQQGPSMAARGLGGGTNVIGNPTIPTHLSSNPPAGGVTSYTEYQPSDDAASYTQNTTTTPSTAYTSPSTAHASPTPPSSMPSYVQTSSVPADTAKTPMDSILQVFNKWSKKAEDYTGNVWNHLKTGPNIAETTWGRISVGTKAMTEGGLENLFRQNFDVQAEEHLLKTYACYLSSSTGPVAGTLYISSHKLAFCSDRPLAIPKSPGDSEGKVTTQQQQVWCFYKVAVPTTHVQSVTPTENTQKKPAEKYVQVKTIDGHEFWFMGFVNYDKGVKTLQETVVSKSTAGPANNESDRAGTVPGPAYENHPSTPTGTTGPTYDTETPTMPASAANHH